MRTAPGAQEVRRTTILHSPEKTNRGSVESHTVCVPSGSTGAERRGSASDWNEPRRHEKDAKGAA